MWRICLCCSPNIRSFNSPGTLFTCSGPTLRWWISRTLSAAPTYTWSISRPSCAQSAPSRTSMRRRCMRGASTFLMTSEWRVPSRRCASSLPPIEARSCSTCHRSAPTSASSQTATRVPRMGASGARATRRFATRQRRATLVRCTACYRIGRWTRQAPTTTGARRCTSQAAMATPPSSTCCSTQEPTPPQWTILARRRYRRRLARRLLRRRTYCWLEGASSCSSTSPVCFARSLSKRTRTRSATFSAMARTPTRQTTTAAAL
mmetsp:Transcript_5895/g.23318  ORF Transcript_5895/g.23318 Transcript_5895/m.23318 type:complete len:262 (+) Transcript_5895:1070-1855(+)